MLIVVSWFMLHVSLIGQTNVDKLVTALDSLTLVSFNNWKISPDLRGLKLTSDPTKAEFDDSQWQTLRIDENVYPDSCWLRKEITLPKTYLGQPIAGSIKFLVSVDDYGYLWVNGESKGHFPWNGEFELTRDAKPGQKFLIAIKAINTGGPLRLLRAELRLEATSELLKTLQDFSLSLKVGQKLLSFDTYQTNARVKVDPKIDKSAMSRQEKEQLSYLLQDLAARVKIDALANGEMDEFMTSLADVRTQLKPISDFAKRFTLYFDANAHIDAAWLWRDLETIEVCKNTFTSVDNIMNARQDFTYTQSSAAYYDWMERLYPDVYQKIQKRVKEGRWEIVGGMWVEPDCNLPSGESWMRHLLYSTRYFKSKFGVKVNIGWNPDSFGYNWNMPMFYSSAGIDAFITQKIGWNETNVFPYRVFWWESADSSRILTYFPFDYVNTIDNPYQLVDWVRQFEANTGFTKMMILFGVGDHGGGPSLEMIDRIERLKTLDIYPAIEYGTAGKYLDWLKAQNLSTIPVWNDEIYLEYHQGTFTTQAKTKEWNRKSEVLLTNAEKFSTIATLYNKTYFSHDLEEAWRKILFNQFHDILPGSSIRENYLDAEEKYNDAELIGTHELEDALGSLTLEINTSNVQHELPLIIFNPLSWQRTDIVKVGIPAKPKGGCAVFNEKGIKVPSQVVQKNDYEWEVLFIAKNVPALGYTVYSLSYTDTPQRLLTQRQRQQRTLENEFFKVTVDTNTGWLNSIIDKRNNKELLSGYGNELQLLEDRPSAWDAWNIGLTGTQYPSKLRTIELVEAGPVRWTLRATRDYLKPGVKKDFPTEDFPSSFFTQDISLYLDIDRIDFTTNVDWWEDKTMLKVAFPVTVDDTVATYEIPFGTIKRSTQWRNSWDSAKVEVPAQRWADLSQSASGGDYGISLLNKGKHGYDIKGNVMRLSLLRSPKWPDPTADRGKHTIEYALYPHSGRVESARTIQRGYEYNTPLIPFFTDHHEGALAVTHSFVRLEPSNLILTTIKKAEDSDSWTFQWYNTSSQPTEATLTLPKTPKKVLLSNFLEEDGQNVTFKKNVVKVNTSKHGVSTVKVIF